MPKLHAWVLFGIFIFVVVSTAQSSPESQSTRDRNWLEDIDSAKTTLLNLDRSFTPATRARFITSISNLSRSSSSMTDDQIVVSLSKAIAQIGNAHTRLYLLRNRTELRRFPIRVWWFGDDLYVVRTSRPLESIVGCKVLTIGGETPQRIFARVAPMYAGSTGWKRYMSTYTMTSPEVLHGIGVLKEPGTTSVSVRCASGKKNVSIAPSPLVRTSQPVESWQDLAPGHISSETPVSLAIPITPLYLRNPDSNYWFQFIPNNLLLYVQFNRAADDPRAPLREFGQQLLKELEVRKPRTLVLDLRFNTGGNLELARELMQSLESVSSAIHVYVIESGVTFSAGIYHVAQWKNWGKAILVGEEPGDALTFWAEGGNFKLPHSDLTVHYADGKHCYSTTQAADDSCYMNMPVNTLSPDLRVNTSFDEYAAGVDPSMTLIMNNEKRAKATLRVH